MLDKSQTQEGLQKRGFELGCSIVRQKGLFKTDAFKCNHCKKTFKQYELNDGNCPKCNGEVETIKKKYQEDSYSITVIGATREQIDKFAETLRELFDQESVIVNFNEINQRYISI